MTDKNTTLRFHLLAEQSIALINRVSKHKLILQNNHFHGQHEIQMCATYCTELSMYVMMAPVDSVAASTAHKRPSDVYMTIFIGIHRKLRWLRRH